MEYLICYERDEIEKKNMFYTPPCCIQNLDVISMKVHATLYYASLKT